MEISLTSEQVKSLLNDGTELPKINLTGDWKQAAVLVPFILNQNKWNVLFTRRSESVNEHKGQVSFPGGAIEPSDGSPITTAMREAYEEIGLRPEHIHVWGVMQPHESVTGYIIYPVVALVEWPFVLKINPVEVSRVFTIPLDWLIRRENFQIRDWLSPFGIRQGVVFYRPYDGEQLWGISARILLDLLEKLGLIANHT